MGVDAGGVIGGRAWRRRQLFIILRACVEWPTSSKKCVASPPALASNVSGDPG